MRAHAHVCGFFSHPLSHRRHTAVLDIVCWSFHTETRHFSHVFHCICLYFLKPCDIVMFCISLFSNTSLRQSLCSNYFELLWRFVTFSPAVGFSAEIWNWVLLKYTDPWTFDKNVQVWVLHLNFQVHLNLQMFFLEFHEYVWSFYPLWSVIRLYLFAH